MIVQVQAILFASLTASLFSAFLAMLGKQWLNRYASTDLRGSAIERSQNRQRKLDGIVTWYFNPLMESPPLMLQAALLLLGYALSRYLWGVNVTIASVVLAVTSCGVIFYIFIIIAGVASESCPYQTPGSLALRYLRQRIPHLIISVIVSAFRGSKTIQTIRFYVWSYHFLGLRGNMRHFLSMAHKIPLALVTDTYHLVRPVIWPLAKSLVYLSHRVHNLLHGASATPEQRPDHQMTVLDFRCISWMLQTSLDNTIRLSALKHLSTTVTMMGGLPGERLKGWVVKLAGSSQRARRRREPRETREKKVSRKKGNWRDGRETRANQKRRARDLRVSRKRTTV